MVISILYFEGCPHWQDAVATVRSAVAQSAPEATVVLRTVDAETIDAEFRGSPTILVNGQDPFLTGSEPTGLSCRYFLTKDGLRGSPSSEQIAAMLERRAPSPAKEG